MSVAFKTVVTDTNPNATSTNQLAFTRPGTLSDGDFMLCAIAVAGGASTSLTLPSGWTLAQRSDNSTSISLAVAYKFAQGEPTTTTFAFGASGTHAGILAVYTGVDQFFPFDATATNQNASSTSQPAPLLQTTAQTSLAVLAFAAASNPTFTPPSGYTERAEKNQTNASIELCDAGAGKGTVASATATLSGAQLGASCSLALRSAVGQTSLAQVDSALKSLFPPGDDDLYDWNNSSDPSELWKLFQATAGFFKSYVYDYVDLLRQEVNPLTTVAKLPEWEGALGITQATASAANKWTATRQSAIISKLRESGATTLAAVGAVLEPLLGYTGANAGTLQVVEPSRAALTAAHTYSNTTGAVIGGNSSVAQTIDLSYRDGGAVSAAGVQLSVTITSTNPEQLSFSLQGAFGTPTVPTQATVTWPAGSLPSGSVTSTTFYLYDKTFTPGSSIQGTWTLTVNTGAAACTLVSWSLFVEGVAQAQGTGGAVFYWGAYADPAKVINPDYVASSRAITRIQPGWSQGNLYLSIAPQADITSGINSALADQCTPGI